MQSNYGDSAVAGKGSPLAWNFSRRSARAIVPVTATLLLTGVGWLGFAMPVQAQDPAADLAFAASLREQFLPDLAAEFLEQSDAASSAAWHDACAIERARDRREYASKVGPAFAALLFDAAKKDLASCQRNGENAGLEPWIRFELARLEAAAARALTERPEQGGAKLTAAEWKLARTKLGEASRLLAACTIPAKSDDPVQNAVAEKDLSGLLTIERGRNALDLARANNTSDLSAERAQAMRRAIAQLVPLAGRDRETPVPWEAMAWLYLCHLENDDARSAQRVLRDLTSSKWKSADRGKQMARALRQLWLVHENDIRSQASLQTDCEDWLRQYPAAHDSWLGWRLRLYLAHTAFAQVAAIPSKASASVKQRDALERAWRLCADVDVPQRDESGNARARRLHLAKILYPDLAGGKTAAVTGPFEGWLRAQLMLAAIQSNAASTPPPDRAKSLDELRQLLDTTVALPAARRFPRETIECQQLLAYCHYLSGDLARAAEEGGALARKYVHSPTAAQAGNLALQALASLQAQTMDAAKSAAMQARFLELARFLIQAHEHQPSADASRHLYALSLGRDKHYQEALQQFDSLSPAYAELPRALYQAASLCLEADKVKAAAPVGAPAYRDRALRFLEKIPTAGSVTDPRQLQTVFAGKRLLIEIYLQSKQWPEFDRVVRETATSFQDLDDKARETFRSPLLALQLFAASIEAERACQAGRFHEGRLSLGPLLSTVRDQGNAALLEDLKQREPAVLTRFLDLSIRTAVLDGQTDVAKEQLELLTRLFPDNPLDRLGATMQVLGEQITSLRKQGEPAKELLEKTAASVAAFLDSLAEQQKNVSRPETLLFLAESYASLEQFGRAVEFASRIAPPGEDKKDDARAQQLFRASRILLVRALRSQKEWKQAEALLDSLLATTWGPSSLDLKKERLFLLQDQGKFAGKQGAILGWNSFMLQLQPRLEDNRLREIYFEGYYQLTYCIYRNALVQTDPKTKDKDLKLAANYILKLEGQADPAAELCKNRLKALLADATPLRQQYDALKKGSQP
jgi:hypothetical protein